ncbi:BLUF domain-containing protein [Salinimicrobium flavum]|uniref:BLUF domain-containing protein n=1 Tax=Salinimicrobium flavum TaxID=1737065 RepID=A0ABW5IUJ6_9FLAO
MLHAICYISTASSDFNDTEIAGLMAKWKQKNSDLDIKGILLFSVGNFFQVLEGEKAKVLELFSGVMKDTRHTSIIQVLGQDVVKGSLDGYKTEHITRNFSRPDLIRDYCEAVKGMDRTIQEQLKKFLETFIDTRVF